MRPQWYGSAWGWWWVGHSTSTTPLPWGIESSECALRISNGTLGVETANLAGVDRRNAVTITATWIQTVDQLPPDGVIVETADSGGNVQTLVRSGNLWFFPDRSMYVYYVPQAWRQVIK